MKVLKILLLIIMFFSSIGLVIAFWRGFLFLDPIGIFHEPNKTDERLYSIGAYLSVAANVADQVISMLLTIQISLFVLVGFTHRKYFSSDGEIPFFNLTLIFLFVLSSFISIYLGYAARLQMFELVNAAKLDFYLVEITIARQALFLSFSAVLAVVAASLPLLATEGMKKCLDYKSDAQAVAPVESDGDI